MLGGDGSGGAVVCVVGDGGRDTASADAAIAAAMCGLGADVAAPLSAVGVLCVNPNPRSPNPMSVDVDAKRIFRAVLEPARSRPA
jgi:hypothetical protein